MAGVSFKNFARTALDDELVADATTMKILGGDWFAFTRRVDFYCLLLGAQRREIIKVTGGASPFYTVERGQEGTSAADWPRGTLCFQNTTAASFSDFEQVEAFRQGAYNPNGALTALYFGEKFYQSDDELWWKSVAAGSTEWRLIAGEIFIDDVEFTPDPGEYNTGQSLEMEVLAAGADIYYTDDGSTPDENSTLYSGAISLPDPGPTTYKARAYGANRWESPSQSITSGAYTIVAGGWQQVVSTPTSDWPLSMTVYKGDLYYQGYSQKLYVYGGDGVGGWSEVCGAPASGGANDGGDRIVSTADHIYTANTESLWRWGTGDGSWSKITIPYQQPFGLVNYKDTHIVFSSLGGASTWSVQSYNISTTGVAQLCGSNYRYMNPSLQGHYYYLGNRAFHTTSGSQYTETAYFNGTSWVYISGTQTNYSGHLSAWCWSATGNFENGTPYFTLQNGKTYHATGLYQVISPPSGTFLFKDAICANIGSNPRHFLLAVDPDNLPSGRLYSWAGSGVYYEEDMDGPSQLSGSDFLSRLWPYNGTIYAMSNTGLMFKWMGG